MSSPEKLIAGYETTFITRAEMTDDGLKTLRERLVSLIGTFDGELVEHEDWGKRRLAYPINKETRGHYTHLVYTGKAGVVSEVERTLRIQDHVMRYLTVQIESEFEKEEWQKQRALAKGRKEQAEEAAYEDRYDN
jgi:small subunit ribosomal protein S6